MVMAKNGGKIERGVKMGEQRSAARGLPFQCRAEPVRIDGEQHQILLAREIFCQRGFELVRGRQMDEPVAEIVGRARELPLAPGRLEGRFGHDFIDGVGHGWRRLAASLCPQQWHRAR